MSRAWLKKLFPAAGFLVPPAVAFMFIHWFASVREFFPVYYAFDTVYCRQSGVILAVSLIISLSLFFSKKLGAAGRIFWPALLFFPLSLLSHDFFALSAVFIVSGWCVYRVPCRRLRFEIPDRIGWYAAGLCGTAVGTWAFLLQSNGYRTQWITADWWVYMQSYFHLAFESGRISEFIIQGGHVNLLPNIVMTLLVQIYPDVRAVFAASAVLLGILPLCAYALGRVYRLSAALSLGFAVLTMFNPILVNQSLSRFYGYHPILFFGPLLFVFFIFREKKSAAGMITAAALSMLVQETVLVFWAGYAVYLCLQKKYFRAASLFCFCTAAFFAVSYWLMPALCGTGSNTQMFHYAALGATPLEVLLSPVLRPEAFWRVISARANFYFLLAVIMPCGYLAWRKASMAVIILPLLAGVLLQESPDLKNPAMQYGYEFSVLLIVMSIIGAAELCSSGRREVLLRSISAGFAVTLLCAFYYGQIPFSRYSSDRIFNFADYLDFHNMLMEKMISEKSRVLTSDIMQPYYLFKRKTAPLSSDFMPGDVVILDVNASPETVEPVRRRLLADRRARPAFATEFGYSRIVVWMVRASEEERQVFMRKMTPDEFKRFGNVADAGEGDFSFVMLRGGKEGVTVLFRVNRRVDYDVEIIARTRQREGGVERRVLFGNGIYPAWYVEPGSVFAFDLPEPFFGQYHISLLRKRVENHRK